MVMNRLATYLAMSVVLLSISVSYSMYFDTLKANVYVDIADLDMDITCYKVCKCCCHCCCCHCHRLDRSHTSLSSDNSSLEIYDVGCPCPCFNKLVLWVGMIIKNNGELPAKFKDVNVSITGSYSSYKVTHFIYGPFSNHTLHPWSSVNCTNPCVPGHNSTLVVDPGHRMILWMKIVVQNADVVDKVVITPIFTPWNT